MSRDLELLLLIRHFEKALLSLFSEGKLSGTTHTCLGQEYIPVSLRSLIDKKDYIFSNHRCHGHYLAIHEDAQGLLAEIMGKSGGICNGYGGSQHLRKENFYSTGIQGEGVGVACGVALSLKKSGSRQLAVSFIGDGTWGEGLVYEALNMASLWKLPLVVVVENNKIAQTTPIELNFAGSVEGRAKAFGINYMGISSNDIEEIREEVSPTLDTVRHGSGPLILEFMTDRLGPHSKGDDTRSEKEIEEIRNSDWYVKLGALPEFKEIEASVLSRIESIVTSVMSSPDSEEVLQ